MVKLSVLLAACATFSAVSASWPNWGANSDNDRNSKDNVINRNNVQNLHLAWMASLNGSISATPSVEPGNLYIVDWAGWAYRVNNTNGAVIWAKNLTVVANTSTRAISRTTPAILSDRIIIGLQGPAMELALNKTDGSLIWKNILSTHPFAVITQSPSTEGGVIYQGVSSIEELAAANKSYPCCSFAGVMNSLNASDGTIIWSTPMIPPSITGVGNYSGAAVWGSSPAYDTNSVYISTGNLYELPETAANCQIACDANPASCLNTPPCTDPNVLFDSVVALNKTTGAIRWATRLQKTDAWNVACLGIIGDPDNCPLPAGPDYDFAQAPILFGTDGLIAAQKSGVAWSLNRTTGAVIWSTIGGPGGVTGGFQWGSTLAIDEQGDPIWMGQVSNSNRVLFNLTNGLPWNASVVVGLDARNGHINWQVPHNKPGLGLGPLSSTRSVAFAPAYETGMMVAFAVDNGERLWNFTTNATLIGGAAIVGNRVYFGNGYVPAFSGTEGRNLYAFEV